ncbi:MAG: beta strand repeat-containing protein [Pyrinomonadaceae bacterium]
MRHLARPFVRNICLLTFAFLACFALWSARGRAATNIVVNSTADGPITVDANCTLREAITAANTNAPSGGCAAGTGADTITFQIPGTDTGCASGVCTINLLSANSTDTTSALVISSDMTITGTGADKLIVKRDGSVSAQFRVFSITSAATTAVEISGMTITNGRTPDGIGGGTSGGNGGSGGGILNAGNLKLMGVTVSGNSGGRGGFSGTSTGNGGDGGSGGGISSSSTLTIQNSTVSNNSTGNGSNGGLGGPGGNGGNGGSGGSGGGISSSSTLTIQNSTVSGNSTGIGGNGGNFSQSGSGGSGGGISYSSTLKLQNSTVSNNSTGSGGSGGSGGGISQQGVGSASLANTIVAVNTVAALGFGPDLSGTFTSQGYNIIGTTNGATFTPTTGDQTPVSAAQLNLGTLANNGGPTQTRALLAGSVAIDKGKNLATDANNVAIPTDQRGFTRPVDDPATTNPSPQPGDLSDIGAFEVLPPNTAPTASATPNPAATGEETPVQITLTGTDAEDNNLTFTITQQPTNGALGAISAPDCAAVNTCTATVTYTPNLNFNGADSFKFKVNDGTTDSAEATVSITVTAIDDTAYVVNTTADPGTGGCDATECTLREAITAANADAGAETITFQIPDTDTGCISGVCTISPTSQLPTITEAVTIDGYTQPGATANTNATGALNTVLKIELNGASAPGTVGLDITAGDSTVSGLIINGFTSGRGIQLTGASATNNVVAGNYVGTNAAGTSAVANFIGIIISSGAANNRIGTNGDGTADAEERNLVSGNNNGILIQNTGTTGNIVAGNFVGTNAAGTSAVANGNGIYTLFGATNNRIGTDGNGTADAAERNVVSGNSGNGIRIESAGTTGNIVAGNFVGTNAAGTGAVANGNGILILAGAANNRVGTDGNGTGDEAERNLVSGNSDLGILIQNAGTSGNTIAGNYVGTNAAGTAALANRFGILVLSGAANNRIGTNADGTNDAAERNLASGNTSSGIFLQNSGTNGNTVAGNYVGTNVNGMTAIPNGCYGVAVTAGASNNTIGGLTAAARNVASGNKSGGIELQDTGTTGNAVQGNYVGVAADGTTPLGNTTGPCDAGDGIIVEEGASGNTIGGTTAGAGNLVAYNSGTGILMYASSATVGTTVSNRFLGNSVFSNSALGIDLGGASSANGVTPNDAGDADTGVNRLQNFPVLASAVKSGATTTVTGTLNSNANSTFRVEFFSNAACDTSGNGEGRTFLGFQSVNTDGSGNATINAMLAATTTVNESVTATATDVTPFDHDNNAGTPDIPRNDTSEFSACRAVVNANTAPTASATPNPATTNEDTAVVITLTGTDVDDNDLTFTITQQPTNGTLGAISAPDCAAVNTCTAAITYTPAANYNGADSFKFKVNDGTVDSAEVTVNITVTAVADLSISDVAQAEGNTGTTTFTFNVTLDSPAPAGGVTFNASTANGTTNPATAGSDYVGFTNQPGSIAQGQTATTVNVTVNGDTTFEPNETYFVNITNVTGATVSDGQGTGTILNDEAGQIIISEFRLRGPVPTATPAPGNENGQLDEFIELYNNTNAPINIGGYTLDTSTGDRITINPNTQIKARGHYLVTQDPGYTLGAYAAGDQTYDAFDLPEEAGIALLNSSNEIVDAVGFTTTATPYREGAGLTAVSAAVQHSFVRKIVKGLPVDTGNNAADFVLVAVDGQDTLAAAVLGAPGPENAQSHIVRNDKVAAALLAPALSSTADPNRVRTGTGNSGTVSFRRTLRNNTGQPITSFRFRVNDLSTVGNEVDGASARLALADSVSFTYDPDNNPATANTTVLSTTLESPSAQTPGGGLNASLRVNLPQPLAAGARFSVNITFNILRAGNYRFSLNHEVLPQP